ncbi:MAG: Rne/Rng family ribonuclease [Candidatus Poribacteria bacterium]|nr:Rne/Rng family ribonuclease [Candidatus Poribacteria bacterium]
MKKEILISEDKYESRCAILENGLLSEIYIERQNEQRVLANIYKGRVDNVLPGMQIAFVEIGLEKHGFLHASDIEYSFEDIEDDNASTKIHADLDDSPPRRQKRRKTEPAITDVIETGQEILVQVAKVAMGTKGARITSTVSLPGKYVVYLPTSSSVGISRRIESAEERLRLKDLVQSFRTDTEGGFIIRTAAEGKSEENLAAEVNYLLNTWQKINQKASRVRAPSLIHKDLGFTERIIRDYFNSDVNELIIDSKPQYETAINYFTLLLPEFKSRVKFYKTKSISMMEKFGIETGLKKALGQKVWLRSGAYIIIEQTEAMVSIDVNTGKFTGENDADNTILKANLEAAEEIVRQLRLRDLGGIVVIDFIDMDRHEDRRKVYQALQQEIKRDRAKTNILRISELGLVEMTRQRTRPSITSVLTQICPYCDGHGFVLSVDTVVTNVLRAIKKAAHKSQKRKFKVIANELVVSRLLDRRSKLIQQLKREMDLHIRIEGNVDLHLEDYQILDEYDRQIRLD